MITQAKKYQAPKDERAQAKGSFLMIFGKLKIRLELNAKLAKKKGAVAMTANGEEASATIYVENLPNEANESMLNLLFQQFPGFKKSRPLPSGGKGRCLSFLIISWLISLYRRVQGKETFSEK